MEKFDKNARRRRTGALSGASASPLAGHVVIHLIASRIYAPDTREIEWGEKQKTEVARPLSRVASVRDNTLSIQPVPDFSFTGRKKKGNKEEKNWKVAVR